LGRHIRTAQPREKAGSARPPDRRAPIRGVMQGAMLFLAGAGVAILVATLIGTSIVQPPTSSAPRSNAPIASVAETLDRSARLGDWLSASDADLAKSDIARLNLAAATGLPGADGLDVTAKLAELDRWAAHVASETERNLHRFREDPGGYENSESYFRALMLIVAIQGDLGVHYNQARIGEPDFTNSKDLFLHGMVGDANGGTCVSMPVLYVAIGRRLGYPMNLVATKGHVFARWDAAEDPDPRMRGRFNIEGTNRGLSTFEDQHYAEWPNKLNEAERSNGWYLRSLTSSEEFAVFLMQRGHCLEDNGRKAEAQVAYAMAHQHAPKSPEALDFLASVVREEAIARSSADSQAFSTKPKRDPSAQWATEQRRQAEEIARHAVERGRNQSSANPATPRPPLGDSAAPRIPGRSK